MSLLTDKTLPDFVTYGGKKYPIHSDFRTWIRFSRLFSEVGGDFTHRVLKAISLCYVRELPPSLTEAINLLMDFYLGGKAEQSADCNGGRRSRIYDFEVDAQYIYGAFFHDYGIDLSAATLHWWQFRALFSSLGEGNKICEIMGYRAIKLSDIGDKKKREHYRRMQRLYRLPDERSEQQREQDMVDALAAVF